METEITPVVGRPQEQLEIEEPPTVEQDEDNIEYPTGPKLWLSMTSVLISALLCNFDLLVVAVAIPSLTNQFHTISDIGWYSSIYGIVASSFTFFFAKMYTLFSIKYVFIVSMGIFEIGSTLCTFAWSSKQFILGRALAGLGAGGINSGTFIVLTYCFPKHKRPMIIGFFYGLSSVSFVGGPIIGGFLIDKFSWRVCFGVNLPLGLIASVLLAIFFHSPVENPDIQLPIKAKLGKMDLIGTFLLMPAITCLLLAMQWGGIRYGWSTPQIIILFVIFGILLAAFAYRQYRLGDKATLPPSILKKRSILAGCWFNACTNGTLAITEYYISIYFQSVRGFSASRSGLLGVPMIAGMCFAGLLASTGTTLIGYYTPFMIATTVLAPIASGLLTTINIEENLAKILALLGFLGVAIGLGQAGPVNAVQTILSAKDVPIGMAITGFGGGLGSSLFLSASSALFQNRLVAEIQQHSVNVTVAQLENVGLSDIRNLVGPTRLKDVLLGYDEAVTQTLYMPVALMVATIIGSALTEWRSVKKKRS